MAQQQFTILIIDDCPEDRELYRRYLLQDQQNRYLILEEETGESGLELYAKVQPDGILLDFLLPDMDGLEFLTQLKQQVNGSIPAVIMLTGHGNETVAVQAMKSGVQDYLVKGHVTAENLRFTIQSAIENIQLRQQLQHSKERFYTSVENMLDCFGIYSAIRDQSGAIIDFRVDYVNAAACENNRMTKEEQIGKPLCEILPAHHESGLFADYCRVVQTGEPLVKESFIYTDFFGQKKLTRAFDIRATKLGDGFIAAWRDITKKQQAEEKLRLSKERFQLAAAAVNSLIYDWDLQSNTVTRTERLTEILGYSLEEAEPTPQWWRERIHPEDLEKLENQYTAITSQQNRYALEYRVLHKNGEYRYLLDRGLIVRDSQGIPIRIVGSTSDISDLKQAEAALRESEESYRYLSEAIPQLVWIWNHRGECEYFNQRWYEFTGQSLEQAMGFGWIQVVHPEDLRRVMQVYTQSLRTGELYEVELRYRGRDGNYHWYLARALPKKDEQGRIVKWFGTSTDIDDRKQLEAERTRLFQLEQAARAEAEAANRAKDEFVAMVSHDLRSPLNAILGWARLLRTRKTDEANTIRALETIERSALSQAKLLEDLLNMSRILRGKMELQLCQVNLVSLIQTALETAYPLATAKNIYLDSHLDDSIPTTIGDPNRLLQVLGNLLSNAIKFTPEGGRVEVRLKQLKYEVSKQQQWEWGAQENFTSNRTPFAFAYNSYAQVTVIDTGIGIKSEFLPYVFERYRQADHDHKLGGLGLGLAIARHLVELHGGTLRAKSDGEGQGATFTMLLPLRENRE